MKVSKKIFVIALILSLICSVSAIAAAEDITFDQSDKTGVSIETDDNLGLSQGSDVEELESVSDEIDSQKDKLSSNDENVLSANHTVEGNEFKDINDAIAAANAGDTIFLGGKNYTGNYNINIAANKNNLTICGGSSLDDDAVATLDCQNHRILVHSSNVVIKGIKFITPKSGNLITWNGANGSLTNCIVNGSGSNYGMISWSGANGSVSDCEFYNLKTQAINWRGVNGSLTDSIFDGTNSNGGGVTWSGVNGSVSDCEFHNIRNTAITMSGANGSLTNNIFNGSASNYGGRVSWSGANGFMSDCEFYNFKSNAVYWSGAKGSLTKTTFSNDPDYYGGGVSWSGIGGSVSDCEFANIGNAVYWNGENGSLTNSIFHNGTGYEGGAVSWYGMNGSIANCEFYNNSASYEGGAIHATNSVKIDSCNFTSNSAVRASGAVNIKATATISNCNFINNFVIEQDNGAMSIYQGSDNSIVENCSFIGNFANRYVGAMKVYSSNVLLKNNTYMNNGANLSSGAVSVGSSAKNCTVEGCKFINNTAGYRGGALNWNGPEGSLIDSHFENNTGVDGGAVFWNGKGANIDGCNFTGNNASNGGAVYLDSNNGVLSGSNFNNNSADFGGAIHTVGNNVTVKSSNFTNNSAKFPGSNIWVDGPDNSIINNNINNSGSNNSAIHITNNHNITIEGNNIEGNNITYTEIVIEVPEKLIGHVGETLEIPVYIHDTLGDPMVGMVNLTSVDGIYYLDGGRVTFSIDITSNMTEAFKLVLTFEHLTKDIWVYPANPDKAIENITQSGDGDDTLVIKFPEDATGNVTVIVGDKNYTAPVINGSAVININESMNGTYNATVIYSGDDIYKNMTQNIDVVVKNSKITVAIEAADVVADINESIIITVTVKNSLGDLMKGNVTLLSEDGKEIETLDLTDGETTFIYDVPGVPSRFNMILRYGNYEKTILIDVIDYNKPIEGINQSGDGNNSVVIRLPGDASGNATVTIGNKNYTAPVVNGTAVINITDLPNGTYKANVTYSGDDQYGNMTEEIEVVITNSNVSVIIEAADKIANLNETVEIPVVVKSSLGDLLPGSVSISYVGGDVIGTCDLVDGKATFSLKVSDVPAKFELVIKYGNNTKFIILDVADIHNPIEGIDQPGDGNNSVVIKLPSDAKGNATVTIGNKNYTVPVVNGIAVINITDLPNGTYKANVTYSGDGKYSNMSEVIDVVISNSNVGVVIEAADKIANLNETVEIPVVVKTTLGDLLPGEVTLVYDGVTVESKELSNGKATFSVKVPEVPCKFDLTVKYGNYTKTIQIEVVDPKNPIGDIEQPGNGSDSVVINLPSDAEGNATVIIGGKNYTVPVVNGTAVINITDLPNGEYPAVVIYSGDGKYSSMNQTITISIKNSKVSNPVYKLAGKNVNVIYSGKAYYKVLLTRDGKPATGEYVSIQFNGKKYNVKTDAKGYATLKLNTKAKVKTHTVKVTYKGVSATNKVKIKQVIKASNKKVKKSAKVTKIKISLKKVNGKVLKKKKLTIKFKGKKYKVKTNKKGVAIWKLKQKAVKKLKVGKKVKYTVSYGKAKLTKKITIKR